MHMWVWVANSLRSLSSPNLALTDAILSKTKQPPCLSPTHSRVLTSRQLSKLSIFHSLVISLKHPHRYPTEGGAGVEGGGGFLFMLAN